MSHYRLKDREPSAIILATNPATRSLDEVKIYAGNEIYLSPKQNFALRFFNPLQETIGAKLTLNGTTFPDMLVLKPGEDVILERFLNDNKKFLFDTYEIDGNNSAAVNAIAKNGAVKIEFFKERINFYTSGVYNGTITTTGLPHFTNTCTTNNAYLYSTRLYASGINTTLSSSVCQDSLSDSDITFGNSNTVNENKIETGRIEKGEESNQKLDSIQMNFENYSFYTVEYKMLPVSSIKNDIKEIREYCPHCKYRVRNKNWVYCPHCGNKLD